jgi:hypothetical protein
MPEPEADQTKPNQERRKVKKAEQNPKQDTTQWLE